MWWCFFKKAYDSVVNIHINCPCTKAGNTSSAWLCDSRSLSLSLSLSCIHVFTIIFLVWGAMAIFFPDSQGSLYFSPVKTSRSWYCVDNKNIDGKFYVVKKQWSIFHVYCELYMNDNFQHHSKVTTTCSVLLLLYRKAVPIILFFLPIILFRISPKMLLLFPRIAPLFSIIIVNYSHQNLRKVHTKTCESTVVLSIRVFSIVLTPRVWFSVSVALESSTSNAEVELRELELELSAMSRSPHVLGFNQIADLCDLIGPLRGLKPY